MKLGNITNLEIIALTENATELFQLKKYKSKKFVKDYIGLGIHRSGFYGTYNPGTDDATSIPLERTSFNQENDVNLLIEGLVTVSNVPVNNGSGDIVYWGRGTLILKDGTIVYDGPIANIIWGGIGGDITDQTDLVAYVTNEINTAITPLDSRITNLENNTHEVTYKETIDITAGTSGSVTFPVGATLDEGDFPQGAVLSTISGGELEFNSPKVLGTPIAATLDTAGNWTTTNTFASPVALVFRLKISGADYSNLDNDKIVEMWLNEDSIPNHASQHESGGVDKINVGGLSGVLADPQTPSAHTHTKADITDFSDGDYATAAQGATADSAIQPGDIANFETSTELDARDTANRDRGNHTGTQTANTISDFDTEVSNNTDVAANTAARHDAATVTDTADIDLTLVGQNISALLTATGVGAGSYERVNLTVDSKGRITAISNGQLGHRNIFKATSTIETTPLTGISVPTKLIATTTFNFGTTGWDMPVTNRIQNNTGSTKRVMAIGYGAFSKVGGGTDDGTFYLALNGAVLNATKASVRLENAQPLPATCIFIGDVSNGSYLEMWGQNNEDAVASIETVDLNMTVIEL